MTTILCVEDNPDNMLLAKRVLQAKGYIVLEAPDATQGITLAETRDVDLILLDINLPDVSGYEVARRIRSSWKPGLAEVPIIAITANALRGDAEKALASGCNIYMSKPFNIHELWARVEAVLNHQPGRVPSMRF
jgi:two-component system cell cycle response regulator DivK